MPSSNVVPSRETLRFKPTADLKQLLGRLPLGVRSEYIRQAFAAYIASCPVLRAIPLEEGLDAVEPDPIGFIPTQQIVDWLSPVPPSMRSYVIRHVIRTYARHRHPDECLSRPPGAHIQPRFDLALCLSHSGSGTRPSHLVPKAKQTAGPPIRRPDPRSSLNNCDCSAFPPERP